MALFLLSAAYFGQKHKNNYHQCWLNVKQGEKDFIFVAFKII
ncbi:hypothetical protein yrohd0001_5250 [Yersinia rohdei ATCC 43380]|nr:hypothetical protein yrohd0001_5250 [Yersinia rohdei ATCC 43380]